MNVTTSSTEVKEAPNKKLFLACFIALVTTSFGFILRALTLPQWEAEFNLTKTQVGEIAGVGLWPFAISIVLFSLIVDKVGYKNSMVFAFICHVSSATLTYFADGYTMLYIATFIMALGNGTVEAAINPAVVSMYPFQTCFFHFNGFIYISFQGGLHPNYFPNIGEPNLARRLHILSLLDQNTMSIF
jgi:MFS family permease